MNKDFSFQKVHDHLEVVNESLEANKCPTDFFAIFNGMAYQHGDVKEIMGQLYRTFPDIFTDLVVSDMADKLAAMENDKTDPASATYWEETENKYELGVTELDLFKEPLTAADGECLDTVQKALSILHSQDLIDGDGNVIGRDLRRVLCSDLGLNEIVNFKELDFYLDDCCGGLLYGEHITVGRHASNGRTRTYNFLNSPFKLY